VKFLVIWKLELSLVPRGGLDAVLRMPDYAAPLERSGKIAARYHIVGAHGGAWIYDVASNEELERLLAIGARLQPGALRRLSARRDGQAPNPVTSTGDGPWLPGQGNQA
jgi:hypothetical protein